MSKKNKTVPETKDQMNKFLNDAHASLAAAVAIAEKIGEEIYWSGPEYGMGGTYVPESVAEKCNKRHNDVFHPNRECHQGCEGYDYAIEAGWQASSHSC